MSIKLETVVYRNTHNVIVAKTRWVLDEVSTNTQLHLVTCKGYNGVLDTHANVVRISHSNNNIEVTNWVPFDDFHRTFARTRPARVTKNVVLAQHNEYANDDELMQLVISKAIAHQLKLTKELPL